MADHSRKFLGCYCVYQYPLKPFTEKPDNSLPAFPVGLFLVESYAKMLSDGLNKVLPGIAFVEPVEDVCCMIEPVVLPFG